MYDEGYARRYRAHDEQLPASPPSQELARWLRDVCQRFAGPIDALDLGCGTGRYFWALTGVQTLQCVDASAAMLAQAERRAGRTLGDMTVVAMSVKADTR